jgi:hypothetical protein
MEQLKLTDVELLCLLFEEYSKNSVFQLSEYADVSKIHTKLKKIVSEQDNGTIQNIELPEIIYLAKMLQIVSTRYKTPIQNWEQILNVYKKLLKSAQDIEAANKEAAEKSASDISSSVEDMSNIDVSTVPE